MASFVVATENPVSTNFCTWDIIRATATPSITSIFVFALYQVQNCPQELVDSNIEQERSDLKLRQMSNLIQLVLGGMGGFQ